MSTMKNILLFTLCFYCVLVSHGIFACTIVKATQNGITFIGNNEDGTDPTSYLWFIPSSEGKYGRVYFTLSDKWPQGGINDQGLFYDGTAGPWKEICKSSGKPVYNGNLSEKMLEECANVPQAIAMLKKYDLSYFRNGQMLLADKYGNSAIVEGDTIIYSRGTYQIATNFYHSKPEYGGFPCFRYDIVQTMISQMPSVSLNTMKTVLEAVHLDGYSFTQYTSIHDLNHLRIHYFADSDFSKYVMIDLEKELQNGEKWYEAKELFSTKTVVQSPPCEIPILDGSLSSSYKNGKIKCRLNFATCKLNGVCEGYYPNGKTAWQAIFDNGRITGKQENWNESGNLVISYEFLSTSETVLNDYFPDGNPYLKIVLVKKGPDGLLPEVIEVYNGDGTFSYKGIFKNGILYLQDEDKPCTGTLCTYFKNGKLFNRVDYKDGALNGKVRRMDENGNIVKTEEFKNGIQTKISRRE